MAKSIAELLAESKTKPASTNPSTPPTKTSEELMAELKQQNQYLETQARVLQEQLQLRQKENEEKQLEKEAMRLQSDKEALKAEADVRKTLEQAFTNTSKKGDVDEELTQRELVAVLAETMDKASVANSKLILNEVANKIKDTDIKVGELKQVMTDLLAGLSVGQARSQFSDFDVYAQDAARILQTTQGLSPADAYMLVKARKASLQPDKAQLETERPTDAVTVQDSTRRSVSRSDEQTEPTPNSRLAWKSAMSAAIDKVLAARKQ